MLAYAQGYGLTETCAASLIANPWRFDHVGTVGMPLCHTMLRLEEVKELNYSPTDEQPAGVAEMRAGCGGQ
eukprot:155499-Chlamydomonas_euryale.AAC.1